MKSENTVYKINQIICSSRFIPWSPFSFGSVSLVWHCLSSVIICFDSFDSLRWVRFMKSYWIIHVYMYRKIRFTRACFITLLTSTFKFFKSFTFVYRKISFSRACIIGLFTATLFKSQTHMYCKIRFTRVCLITLLTSTYFKSLKFNQSDFLESGQKCAFTFKTLARQYVSIQNFIGLEVSIVNRAKVLIHNRSFWLEKCFVENWTCYQILT